VAAIFAALLMVATAPARASLFNFDFSFTGALSFPGTVSGEIDGLTNNATSAASAVYIDSSSSIAPFSLPFNTIGSVFLNSFTVTNGELTDVKYLAHSSTYLISLNDLNGAINSFLVVTPTQTIANGEGLAGLSLTPDPEPSALVLLGTAVAALFLFKSWVMLRNRRTISFAEFPAVAVLDETQQAGAGHSE
jgi:hypothetical protein